MRAFVYAIILVLLTIGLVGCSAKKASDDADSEDITTIAEKDTLGNDAEADTPADPEIESEAETQADLGASQEAVTQAATTTPAPEASKVQTEVMTNFSADASSKSQVVKVTFQSDAIAKNVIGDTSTRRFYIYLPPTYNSSDTNYPVVYFLHGYGDSPLTFLNSYKKKLDEAFQNGAKEFILVILDGNNKTGGSFYVNSPASGNWEDYIVNEVVTCIDENYRTIADSNSRGISGYSMGGFGALYLSLRHPDIFDSTLVFCPGVFAEDDLAAVLSSWRGSSDIKRSYAQAFSPDINITKDYGNILQDSDIEAQNQIWSDWMNGFSNWGQKLDAYLALNKPLKSIKITYCEGDYYQWIPGGCEYLIDLLEEKQINHSTDTFTGGHIVPPNAIENYFVPFFGETLTYQ